MLSLLSLRLEKLASWMHSKEESGDKKKGKSENNLSTRLQQERNRRSNTEFLGLSKRFFMDGEGGCFFLPQ